MAISGSPGVGKSTFINSLGTMLLEAGMSIAVLAIDPSSNRTGGSVLGDKSRMEDLVASRNAYIRPSPTRCILGGVATRTRETTFLCEQFGFDVVLVETTGVGQSELAAADMTDLFILLCNPAGGDGLQAIKRGIMEVADLILVTKADGGLYDSAIRTTAEYAGALRYFRQKTEDPPGYPRVIPVSAHTGSRMPEVWTSIESIVTWRKEGGHWARRRKQQEISWFHNIIRDRLLLDRMGDETVRAGVDRAERQIQDDAISPQEAASDVLNLIEQH